MASLIIHGDLSAPGEPLDRPLYVRPIMRPHELSTTHEQVDPERLFPDLLHRAIRRIQEGEDGREATAPSVRIVNLSIGAQARALTRRRSPVGRLLDWLAHTYNLLFIVSAGNHTAPIRIPATSANTLETARHAATRAVYEKSILKGILPPGDALNALTIGATHDDGLDDTEVSDAVWNITNPGAPAYYGATGPGVDRSIKPDLHHIGGRHSTSDPFLCLARTWWTSNWPTPLRLAPASKSQHRGGVARRTAQPSPSALAMPQHWSRVKQVSCSTFLKLALTSKKTRPCRARNIIRFWCELSSRTRIVPVLLVGGPRHHPTEIDPADVYRRVEES